MSLQQVILGNNTPINGISFRTVQLDGKVAPSTNPYPLSNCIIAFCDTTTLGNIFIRLVPGSFLSSDSIVSASTNITLTDQYIVIKNTGSGTVTLSTTAGITINGGSTYVVTANSFAKFILNTITLPGGTTSQDWSVIMAVLTTGGKIPSIASSTANAVVRWSGAGGNTFKDSSFLIDAGNDLVPSTTLNFTGVIGTRTSQLSNTTNTTAAVFSGATPPSSTSVLLGNLSLASVVTLGTSVIFNANNALPLYPLLTTSTDNILSTFNGFTGTTSITNSIAIAMSANVNGVVADAIMLNPTSQPAYTITTMGARPIFIGSTTTSSQVTAMGDDTIYIEGRGPDGAKPSLRNIMLGNNGMIEFATTTGKADITMIGSSVVAGAGTTVTDDRVIYLGSRSVTANNSLNTTMIGNETSIAASNSTNCVHITSNTANDSNTDCVSNTGNIRLTSCSRTVVFGKQSANINIISAADTCVVTAAGKAATDTTSAGISIFTNITLATGLGNTGFGHTVGTSITAGTNNSLVGTGFTSVATMTTCVGLGTSLNFGGGSQTSTLVGNGLTIGSGGTNTSIIALGIGAVTPSNGFLSLGTASTAVNTSNAVGAAGAASAPPTPAQYLRVLLNGNSLRIPLFNP